MTRIIQVEIDGVSYPVDAPLDWDGRGRVPLGQFAGHLLLPGSLIRMLVRSGDQERWYTIEETPERAVIIPEKPTFFEVTLEAKLLNPEDRPT